jgi:hypothetical protein
MKVVLDVIQGPRKGRSFVIDRHDTFIVGRSRFVHCAMPEDTALSRDHFLIDIDGPRCELRDLGSTNGTYVNNTKVERASLCSGDLIAAGQSVFRVYVELKSPESDLCGALVDLRHSERDDSYPHSPGSRSSTIENQRHGTLIGVFREATSGTESLLEECVRIRGLLELNHVKWDHAEQHGLIDEVLKPEAYIRNLLGAGFYRLVVLDGACGIDPGGVFDEGRFLETVRADIVKAFGLQPVGSAFHIEDIFQMLKDEQRSLFCFVNFQLIPVMHLRTVRGFTQGVHRVLLLTQGSRDIAREEGLVQR